MTRPAVVSPAQVDQIVRYWRGHMKPKEIASVMGLHTTTVQAVLRQNAAEAVRS